MSASNGRATPGRRAARRGEGVVDDAPRAGAGARLGVRGPLDRRRLRSQRVVALIVGGILHADVVVAASLVVGAEPRGALQLLGGRLGGGLGGEEGAGVEVVRAARRGGVADDVPRRVAGSCGRPAPLLRRERLDLGLGPRSSARRWPRSRPSAPSRGAARTRPEARGAGPRRAAVLAERRASMRARRSSTSAGSSPRGAASTQRAGARLVVAPTKDGDVATCARAARRRAGGGPGPPRGSGRWLARAPASARSASPRKRVELGSGSDAACAGRWRSPPPRSSQLLGGALRVPLRGAVVEPCRAPRGGRRARPRSP